MIHINSHENRRTRQVINDKVTQKHCSAESDLQVVSQLHILIRLLLSLLCKNKG